MLYSDCFFTASLIDMIVLETNHYATEMLPKAKTVWFDVTADDIMCFLALFILMGNVQKPKMQSYWTTDAMNATPFLQHAQCSHCKRCISYSNSVCLSIRLSVCPSHAGIVSKRRHVARCSLHRRIAKCV